MKAKAEALLGILRVDLLHDQPLFEKLAGDLDRAFSCRMNIRHRSVDGISAEAGTVRALRIVLAPRKTAPNNSRTLALCCTRPQGVSSISPNCRHMPASKFVQVSCLSAFHLPMTDDEELSAHVLRLRQWLDAHESLVQEILPFSNPSKSTSIQEIASALNKRESGRGDDIISQIDRLIDAGCGIATYRHCSIKFPRHESAMKGRQLRQLRLPQLKVNRVKRHVRCVVTGSHSSFEKPDLADARSRELFKNMSHAFPTGLEIVRKAHVCNSRCSDTLLPAVFDQSATLEIYWKTEFLSAGSIASQTESLRRTHEAYQNELISRTH